MWSTGAHVADYLLVLARSGFDDAPKRSMTLFLVPRLTPGVEMKPLRKLGMRALRRVNSSCVLTRGFGPLPPSPPWSDSKSASPWASKCSKPVVSVISGIDESSWTPIDYSKDGEAEVAECDY